MTSFFFFFFFTQKGTINQQKSEIYSIIEDTFLTVEHVTGWCWDPQVENLRKKRYSIINWGSFLSLYGLGWV
jgi:hypothetical protein